MALRRWGFIHTLGPDAQVRRDEVGSAACVLLTAGVPAVGDAHAQARRLVDDGAELIDLCGAFGRSAPPPWSRPSATACRSAGCSTGRGHRRAGGAVRRPALLGSVP
jgi:hypothetical protein